MDVDSDDEGFYGPAEPANSQGKGGNAEVKMEDAEDGEEEGEEVEDEDDSDDEVNFITDAPKDEKQTKNESPPQWKKQQNTSQSIHDPRKASTTPVPATKAESPSDRKQSAQSADDKPGTEYPGRHTSKLDPNGNPILPNTGKPILSTDFDVDFPSESSKPWRKPGSDITDYFNYGFDEFTWASYCLKQQQMPKEVKEINNQAEQMKAFVEGIPGGGMPGMPAMPAAAAGSGAMPQMPGMPSEDQMGQMFQTMMSQGMDPSSMDFNQFMSMMGNGGGSGQGFPGQGQGFGTGGVGAPQQPAGMNYNAGGGFDQGGGGGYHGGGRGRGRGRGNRY